MIKKYSLLKKQSDYSDYTKDPKVNEFIYKNSNTLQNPVIETPEFKKWFGDSKVVSKNNFNTPEVVYHQTKADFTEFVPGKGGKGVGIYFAPGKHRDNLPAYSSNPLEDKSKVLPCYLKIEEPLRILSKEQWLQIRKELLFLGKLEETQFPFVITPGIYKKLQEWSVDGIFFSYQAISNIPAKNKEDLIKIYPVDEYVVFSPNQIKSVYGNTGEFGVSEKDFTK